MAAPKKPKKEKNPNPNVVLVIFLIFFVLLTIGLGVWVYYDQETMAKATETAQNQKTGWDQEKLRRAYFSMLSQELRMALGNDLTEKEKEELRTDRGQFESGKFASEKNKDEMKKLLDDLKTQLGTTNDDNKFLKSVFDQIKPAKDEVGKLQAARNAVIAKNKRAEDVYAQIADKRDEFEKDAFTRIQKTGDDAVDRTKKRSQSFVDLVESNRQLQKDLKDKADEILTLNEDNEKKINILKDEIAKLQRGLAQQNPAGPQAQAVQIASKPFPLLLNLSPGRPLWDVPVGKVMRVDPDLRQVTINIGATQGAKPELTFNIFGPGLSGLAEKQMKGSLEIIRVVDANTSIARITSLYDADGREIALNDASRARVLREAEAPLREGDLLFNMFWGTRVAVAGYVYVTGERSDSPAEQIGQMEAFAHLCQRNGMQVDAFVDMRDGQVRGAISSKTRYLIIGDDLKDARPKKKDKVEEEPKEVKDEAPTDRNTTINRAMETLHQQAVANGLLIISAENFATVIGYRRARSANNPEISGFRPSLPYAGIPGPDVDNRPKDAKKDAEPKEKENKQAN